MDIFNERKSILSILVVTVLFFSIVISFSASTHAVTSRSIELKNFYWKKFPLKVLVDMNQWSLPHYAIAIHEALDDWMKSIWNYTNSFTNMTLMINYLYYVSNVNLTNNYDVFITFTPDEVFPDSNAVGLTTLKWDLATHEPISPIIINITTYSRTADYLFVKNVAMHEFGHTLGLGHASSPNTSDGPELMYYTSSNDQIVYPSTLDVYGLLMLYEGTFGQIVQLPLTIPYKMLAGGDIPLPIHTSPLDILYPLIWELQSVRTKPQVIFYQPMILLIPSAIWMVIALAFGLVLHSGKKGAIIAIISSVIIAFYFTTWDLSPISLSFKIIPLLPSIAVGACIGGFISHRLSRKKIERVYETQEVESPENVRL